MTMQKFPPELRLLTSVATLQGATDALAAINTTLLPDNSLVMVSADDELYVLRRDSTAAESSPDIIAPDQGGPGRWYRYGSGAGFFQNVTASHTTIPPQTSIDTAVATVLGVASSNDVIDFNVTDTGLNAGIALGHPRITAANSAVWRVSNITGATIPPGTVSMRVVVNTSP